MAKQPACESRNNQSVIAVIPARYESSRLPGKPLLNQTGKYLIQHTYENVQKASWLEKVVVATDDRRIFDAVKSFGGDVEMTRRDHLSGSDRVCEVIERYPRAEFILNIQGDEPTVPSEALNKLIRVLQYEPDLDVATLAAPLPPERITDPNAVKVVLGLNQNALYFSRSAIPYNRDRGQPGPCLLHLGVYAYRRSSLVQFSRMSPTPLEQAEKLEQLRLLEHGKKIRVLRIEEQPIGIDTPRDYERFVAHWQSGRGRMV